MGGHQWIAIQRLHQHNKDNTKTGLVFKCYPKQIPWYQLQIKSRKDLVIEMSVCQDVTAFIRSHWRRSEKKKHWQNCVKGDVIVVECHCCSSFFFPRVFVLLSQRTVTNTFYWQICCIKKAAIKTRLPLPLWVCLQMCLLYIVYLNPTNYEHRRRWELSFTLRTLCPACRSPSNLYQGINTMF